MAEPLDESAQPGAPSRQDRSDLAREIQRRVTLIVPRVRSFSQTVRERMRRLRGQPHVIDFFHQVDDAYSELALQAIALLRERYDVTFRFHLVGQTDRLYAPEPEMLADYGRRDCAQVAPHYGLQFPPGATRRTDQAVARVEALLAPLRSDPRFVDVGIEAGRALWNDDQPALEDLERRIPSASSSETRSALEEGNALRERLRHYSGGVFWYGGEWYWGVDRLHHLERRLIGYGATRPGQPTEIRFDRPPLDFGSKAADGRLRLEIYPSLRSPYTAMIFDRSLELAASIGLPVEIRPVMPMVMRGVPVPTAKGLYIMGDALREARQIGQPFGNMFDPVGRPVERGFSLWPFASEKGRGAEFVSAFLRAAFVEGRATGSDEGLRYVVEEAGLDWAEAQDHVDREGWREILEENRQTMYRELEVWGVPSYRLIGPEGEPDLATWGQDRLWLVAAEVRRRLAAEKTTVTTEVPSRDR